MSYQGGPWQSQFSGNQPPPALKPKRKGRRIAFIVLAIITPLLVASSVVLFLIVRPFGPAVVVPTPTPTTIPTATMISENCTGFPLVAIRLPEPPISKYDQPVQASGCTIVQLDLPSSQNKNAKNQTPVPMRITQKTGVTVSNEYYAPPISQTPTLATATVAAESNGLYEISIAQQSLPNLRSLTITFSGVPNASKVVVRLQGERQITMIFPQPLANQVILLTYQ